MTWNGRVGGVAVFFLGALLPMSSGLDARAQESRELGWSNSTDISYVTTQGNSQTNALGIDNLAKRRRERSELTFKVDSYRADRADDRFALVTPGLTWLPGENPPVTSVPYTIVDPAVEPDVFRVLAETKYTQDLGDRLLWGTAFSWDRNEDAGIINRFIVSGGLGHRWWRSEDHEFVTTYGLSFTDREEDQPDPEKDARFAGIRVTSHFLDRFGKFVLYGNEFSANAAISDPKDYSLEMTNEISVKVSEHLALKVSLLWHYNAEPALEDVDLIARAQIVDPDGVPGTGDEYFQSSAFGSDFEVGEVRLRKKALDATFRTSLTMSF